MLFCHAFDRTEGGLFYAIAAALERTSFGVNKSLKNGITALLKLSIKKSRISH